MPLGVCSVQTGGPFHRASSLYPPPPSLARAFPPGVASPCPIEPGHRGAGVVALPRDRSAAVTRTVGPKQRSVRWAVAALRLEGPPGRRRGRPAPRSLPLQLGFPSRPSPRGRGASGVRPRPPSWDPSSVTCDSGAGPSPAHSPTSAAAEAPSRPRGSTPAPRSRPICK